MMVVCVILVIAILECTYCSIMKKRTAQKSNRYDNEVHSQISASINRRFTSNMKRRCAETADAISFILFKVTGYIPLHFVRKVLYKYVFKMDIDIKAVIYYGLEARCPWNVKIGKGSIIGDKVIFDARCGIEIGENVNISTGAWIWTLQHDINSKTFTSEGMGGKVTVGNRAWISSRTTILPGCNIAEGVVVAAGAVVTKPIIDEFSIWGGVPAKKLGDRNKELSYTFNGEHRPFI